MKETNNRKVKLLWGTFFVGFLTLQSPVSPALAEGVQFTRAFAPQAGLVSQYEESARQEICLNGSWRFQGDKDTGTPGDSVPQLGAWDNVAIKIPSPWNVNSFSMTGNEQ